MSGPTQDGLSADEREAHDLDTTARPSACSCGNARYAGSPTFVLTSHIRHLQAILAARAQADDDRAAAVVERVTARERVLLTTTTCFQDDFGVWKPFWKTDEPFCAELNHLAELRAALRDPGSDS